MSGYSIYAVANGSVKAWQNVRGEAGSVSLPLANGTPYQVYVMASNDKGFGPAAGPLAVTERRRDRVRVCPTPR